MCELFILSKTIPFMYSYLSSVIGLSDGLTVPFALAAGLSSLGESKLVVIGGVAELIAGAISMGIGGFLASQAERDHFQFLERTTAARVQRSCAGEMEREVHAVLGPIGVDEKLSIAVAKCLKDVENASGGVGANGGTGDAEEGTVLRWSKDVGLTPFLLKFGEGLGMSLTSYYSYPFSQRVYSIQRTFPYAAATSQLSQ